MNVFDHGLREREPRREKHAEVGLDSVAASDLAFAS
jgi:hypothetical protein